MAKKTKKKTKKKIVIKAKKGKRGKKTKGQLVRKIAPNVKAIAKKLKNERISYVLTAQSKYKVLKKEELTAIVAKIIKTAEEKKRNTKILTSANIFSEFSNYILSDKQAMDILNSILKSGIKIKDYKQKKFTLEEAKEILSKQKRKKINKAQETNFSAQDKVNDGTKSYLSLLSSSKMLNFTNEIYLAKMLESKNSRLRQLAKDQLVTSNLRLVTSIAKKFLNHGLELDDLVQEGISGLMKAIEKYNWRLGNKFSTYATWWIRQAITRAIAEQSKTIRIPVHMVEVINHVGKAEKELTQRLGRQPTINEITTELGGQAKGFTTRKVVTIKKINIDPISLDKTVGNDDESQILDFVKQDDVATPDEFTKNNLLREQVAQMFKSTLTPNEQTIVKMRFGMFPYTYPHNLDEVAQKLKKPREEIRQIEAKALRKLKHPSKSEKLRSYVMDEKN